MSTEIPETRPLSDLEKFVVSLRQLAISCRVRGVSSLQVTFEDGSCGGHKALWIATGLFEN